MCLLVVYFICFGLRCLLLVLGYLCCVLACLVGFGCLVVEFDSLVWLFWFVCFDLLFLLVCIVNCCLLWIVVFIIVLFCLWFRLFWFVILLDTCDWLLMVYVCLLCLILIVVLCLFVVCWWLVVRMGLFCCLVLFVYSFWFGWLAGWSLILLWFNALWFVFFVLFIKIIRFYFVGFCLFVPGYCCFVFWGVCLLLLVCVVCFVRVLLVLFACGLGIVYCIIVCGAFALLVWVLFIVLFCLFVALF